ncbi:MAG: CBS domain-containing protein [Sulfuritalea sp.]|nr:CBS domain-containing protein [Sulfuritalea sp.]
MFSIYGLTGQIFSGTLEQLGQVRAAVPVRRVRAIDEDGREWASPVPAGAGHSRYGPGPGAEAVREYATASRADLERGPLYRAEQIMQRPVIVLRADDDVAQAWRTLSNNRIHQSPVLDAAGRLAGLVSERNLLTALNVEDGVLRDVLARRVSDVMSSPVVSAHPATDIRRIARVMLDYGVDGVPVVDADHVLAGFISRSDILHAVIAEPPVSLWR